METTIDIAGSILSQAQRLAAERDTTLEALIEEGLHKVLADRREKHEFRLRRVTFGGRGMRPGMHESGWTLVRDTIYSGHGA